MRDYQQAIRIFWLQVSKVSDHSVKHSRNIVGSFMLLQAAGSPKPPPDAQDKPTKKIKETVSWTWGGMFGVTYRTARVPCEC